MDTSPQIALALAFARTESNRKSQKKKDMKPRKNVDETGKRETGATKEPFLFGLCLPGEFLCELQF
jgi:hypothetical protein